VFSGIVSRYEYAGMAGISALLSFRSRKRKRIVFAFRRIETGKGARSTRQDGYDAVLPIDFTRRKVDISQAATFTEKKKASMFREHAGEGGYSTRGWE